MFKLTYQAFIVFRLLSGYILIRLLLGLKKSYLKVGFLVIFGIGAAVIMTYPRLALRSYYKELEVFEGRLGKARIVG